MGPSGDVRPGAWGQKAQGLLALSRSRHWLLSHLRCRDWPQAGGLGALIDGVLMASGPLAGPADGLAALMFWARSGCDDR